MARTWQSNMKSVNKNNSNQPFSSKQSTKKNNDNNNNNTNWSLEDYIVKIENNNTIIIKQLQPPISVLL